MKSIAVGILTRITATKWHLKANLMRPLVEKHGALSTLRWFATNLPKYEKILEEWGPLRTHSLTTSLSIANGCAYCAYGHGLAFNLYYFEGNDPKLFDLSARDIARLSGENAEREPEVAEEETIRAMQSALGNAGLDDLVPGIDEIFEIKRSQSAGTDDEHKLLHFVQMFEYLNVCGREACPPLDGAHSPINKNVEVKERYESARPGELPQMQR